jgi:hypothetical protein
MPYTEEELENVDFYKEFVENLRNNYLNELLLYAAEDDLGISKHGNDEPFRDENGVLYSFEDMFTGYGMEDTISTFVDERIQNDVDSPNTQEVLNAQHSYSEAKYPQYTQGSLLDSIIDRNITELAESTFLIELPEGLANGDIVTNDDASDYRKWLIDDGQKRLFADLGSFFSSEYAFVQSVVVLQAIIDSIPSGDIVE